MMMDSRIQEATHRRRTRLRLILAVLLCLVTSLCMGCGAADDQTAGEDANQSQTVQTTGEATDLPEAPAEDGTFDQRDDVARYLYVYGKLPDNYITKKEARALGWEGGSVEVYAPGKCIGGDYYGNYEGILPSGDYHECDIDTLGRDGRGAKRLVYSEDEIYYTEDHYGTFELLYDASGER